MTASKEVAPVAKRKPPAAGKGRVKGSKNKITKAVKQAVLDAFNEVGSSDYLVKIARADPKTVCGLLGRVIPQEVNSSVEANVSYREIICRVIEPKP